MTSCWLVLTENFHYEVPILTLIHESHSLDSVQALYSIRTEPFHLHQLAQHELDGFVVAAWQAFSRASSLLPHPGKCCLLSNVRPSNE
jgi:hypothetical protein